MRPPLVTSQMDVFKKPAFSSNFGRWHVENEKNIFANSQYSC